MLRQTNKNGGHNSTSRILTLLFLSLHAALMSPRNGGNSYSLGSILFQNENFNRFRPFSFTSENDILGHSGVANARVMNNFGMRVLQIFTTSPTWKGVRCAEQSAVRDCRISSRIQRQILATATRYGLLQVSGDA